MSATLPHILKSTGRRHLGRFFTNFADPTLVLFRKCVVMLFSKCFVVLFSKCISLLGSTTFRCFKILPPASSYIIIPHVGIIIYGVTGGTILKQWNFVDTISVYLSLSLSVFLSVSRYIQRIPENRKLPYSRMSICKTMQYT
jgi:hypothetical protein